MQCAPRLCLNDVAGMAHRPPPSPAAAAARHRQEAALAKSLARVETNLEILEKRRSDLRRLLGWRTTGGSELPLRAA